MLQKCYSSPAPFRSIHVEDSLAEDSHVIDIHAEGIHVRGHYPLGLRLANFGSLEQINF